MGTVALTEFISLDGVVEAPGGEDFRHKDWSFRFDRGEDGDRFKVDEALGAAALLIGRTTYDSFADAWPGRQGDLAEKYNTMPKYVVSSTLTDPTWQHTEVITGDITAEVVRLKDEIDGELQVPGSIRLAQYLLAHDLVDVIRLMTFPVVLGTGRRLFGEAHDLTTWTLTEARRVGADILVTEHRRAH
ncbi:dihydrofolate reductase family protein [Georgenia alba]|uniref:Dihydrofolate reductase family protein n=1 Tax=Georgenia alba TaxID=2233858 RepID=A0ABW2QCJ6_9MICO